MKSLLAIIVVQVLTAHFSCAQEKIPRGPVFGYCNGTSIYCSEDNAASGSALSTIIKQPLLREIDEIKSQTIYSFAMVKDGNRMYRWRIVNDTYFGGSADIELARWYTKRIPIVDLDLFDVANPIPYDLRTEQRKNRYPHDASLSLCHLWLVEPLHNLYQDVLKVRPPVVRKEKLSNGDILHWDEAPKVPEVVSDLLPLGKSGARLFVLTKKRFSVWSGNYFYVDDDFAPAGSKYFRWRGKWNDKPDEDFTVPFDEPFFVIAFGDDYYFVTQQGNLYLCSKQEKGKPRDTVELWKHADQPITRVITDTTTNKVFAFTTPQKSKDGTFAKPVYFEIATKPEPVAYDPKSIKPSKAAEPMKTVREAVDVLLAAKKIIPAEPKDKR